jgi:hypothetical protein
MRPMRSVRGEDQTRSDLDQASGDADQTHSGSDQTGSDRDPHAADRDQLAADGDAFARHRDLAALTRDRAAEARDREADEHDAETDRLAGSGAERMTPGRRSSCGRHTTDSALQPTECARLRTEPRPRRIASRPPATDC